MKPLSQKQYILNFLKKLRLKSAYFHIFTYIFNLIKLLPVFIITHDWNVIHTKGISHYLIELTLGPILYRINDRIFSIMLLTFFLLLSIVPFIFLAIYYCKFKHYSVFLFKSKLLFQTCVWLIYIFPFLLNQYIFTICVFNFFMKKHHPNTNDYIFIIIIIIQIVFICFCLGVSFVLLILSIGPFYSTSNVLVTSLGSIELKWICFSICQGIIEMEYFVDFKVMIYIKCVIRGLFVLYVLACLFNLPQTFLSNFTLGNIIFYMCFFSCFIEFCAMYTLNDDLKLLSSNVIFVFLKFILEVILAIILNVVIKNKEEKRILNFFNTDNENVNSNTSLKNVGYALFSKFLLKFSGLTFDKKSTKLTLKLINKFQTFFLIHKENCHHKKDCFCKKHKVDEIKMNFDKFYFLNESNPRKFFFSFKEFCPALFDYVDSFLNLEINKASAFNNGELILLLILFQMECNKNYTMTYYYIDKYIHTSQYKNSLIIRIQTELIKARLKYFNKLLLKQSQLCIGNNQDESATLLNQENSKLQFKNIIYYMKIEKEIQKSFDLYYELLIKTTINDDSKDSFEGIIKSISKNLKLSKDTIIFYINSYFQTNNEKCLSFQICSKLSLFFKFFSGKIPKKMNLYFQPLTNFYNLSKFQINDNIILLRLSNTKNVVMHIEYISDSLLVELGFSTHIDLKLETLNDIISQKYSSIYEKYLIDQVLKGEQHIQVSYILLRDKFNFLRLYHCNVNLVITDKYVALHCILKTVNKSNNCFVILNNTGNIIGMSQEFNDTFYLNMNIINKLQLILFNDLLGLNFEEQNLNKTLNIETIKFYENINLLSANLIFENNQEEYAHIYQAAREAITKIKKSPLASLVKTLEIHLIPFSLTKDTPNDLFFIVYFTIMNKSNVNLLNQVLADKPVHENSKTKNINWRSSKDILTLKIESGLITPSPEKLKSKDKELEFQSMMKLSKDKSDIIEKLNLIKELGIAILHFVYGIKQKILDELFSLYKKNSTNNDEFNYESINNRAKARNITKNKLFFQMKLFICIFIFFFCFTIFVEIYSNSLYNKIHVIVETQVYLIIAKKIINSLATAVIGMALIQNNIQNGTIDYGFDYSYNVDVSLLKGRTEDYLENFKKFRENYYSNTFQSFPNLDLIKDYLLNDIDFIAMDINYQQTTEKHSLYEIFNFLHIKLKSLMDIELNPLYFNNTNGNFKCTKCDSEDVKVEDTTDLAADAMCVFVLKNFLTGMNYPLIEIINYFEELISSNIQEVIAFILTMNIVNSLVILVLLIYQLIVYYNVSTELFVKWFLNICNLRFFSIILLHKTKLLKAAIDIATIDSITHLTMTKLKIANSKEENEILQATTKSIDEEFQFQITPFHVVTEIKEWEQSMNLRTNFIRQTNSEFVVESNFLKPPTLKRQLTQTNEEEKKPNKFQSPQFNKKANITRNKRLSKTNIALNSNISSLNNVTSDNLVQKSLNAVNNQVSGSGMKEKRIAMSVHHSGRIILILIFIVLAALISLGHFIFSKMLFNLLQNFSYNQSITLLRSNYFHEVFLCYQIIVLNNEPLYFEYKSKGFLNHTKQTYYLNTFINHDVFNETLARYNLLSDIYETIITDPSNSGFQKNLIELEMKLRRSDACQDAVKFLVENKSVLNIKLFVSLIDYDTKLLAERCEIIGGGYNKKGLRTAFASLVNYVTDNYKDFIAKGEFRDSQYNYNTFQEPTIQTYQLETNRMLELLFFNYQIAILMDYENRYNSLTFINTLYLIGVIFILFIFCWIYLDKFTKYYVKMDNSIEKVKNIVTSTIMY